MVFRGELWKSLIGNDLRLNQQVFDSMKDRASQVDNLIMADIPRAFPHLNRILQEVHSLE